MSKFINALILICTVLSLLASCTTEQHSEDIVAILDGYTITENDIEKEIRAGEIQSKILGVKSNENLRKASLNALGVTEENLTQEQKQYLDSIDRLSKKNINKNEAFNLLIRDIIRYKQALKEDYKEVTKEEILDSLEENKKSSEAIQPQIMENLELKYEEVSEYEDEVAKEYGFESFYDYLKKEGIEKVKHNDLIVKFKYDFLERIEEKEAVNGIKISALIVKVNNAWDNYTEYLLRNEEIEILDDTYSIEYYGGKWEDQ